MAGLKASPRNSVLGAISDALASAKRQGNRVNVPILGGLGDLLIGKTPEEVNEWAYGNAPMQVTGRGTGSLIPQTKRGRGEQLLDAATTLPGMIAAPLRAAPTIAKGAAGQIHRGMMGEGPLRGALSAVAPMNVIKDKGGNWLSKELERTIKPELRATNLEQLMNDPTVAPFLQPEAMEKARTMDKWVQGPLKKYIMRDMASPEDPIRKLAEQGILHVDPQELNFNMSTYGKFMMPNQRLMAQSDMAKNWEGATDRSINQLQVKNTVPADVQENPWLSKLGPEEEVYAPFEPKHMMEDLGLDRLHQHVYDALLEGRIRPEQLNSGSFGVEAAVRDAHNVRMAKAAAEEKAALETLKGEAVFEHKAYPEGYRWVEFKALGADEKGIPELMDYLEDIPEEVYNSHLKGVKKAVISQKIPEEDFDEFAEDMMNDLNHQWAVTQRDVDFPPLDRSKLQQALTAEGDYMGHCVGDYCDDVIAGNKRIFALRDPEGKPHVTVEAQRGLSQNPDLNEEDYFKFLESRGLEHGTDAASDAWFDFLGESKKGPWMINQVKGSGKRDPSQAITPEILETVQPYLKDFLNSQPWGTVRDMKNTGLRDMSEYAGHKGSRFMTLSEHDELLKANPRLKSLMQDAIDDPNFNDGWIPDEHIEMAEGGLVPPPHFEDLDRFLGR